MPRNYGAILPVVLLTSNLLLFTTACKVAPPGKMETSVMTNLKRRVTVRGKADRNPVDGTPETVAFGDAVRGDVLL